MVDYVMLAVLWLCWCILHSLLVAQRWKAWMAMRLGKGYRFYRLAYNLFSLVTLVAVLAYTRVLKGAVVFQWDGWLHLPRFALLVGALWVFWLGLRRYDMGQFLGLRQAQSGALGDGLKAGGGLDSDGILGVVRHPWYLAGCTLVWLRDLTWADVLANAFIVGYFVLGARLEERKLVQEFGLVYTEYQKKVAFIVPWRWAWERVFKRHP